ncbi:MAG: glycosyltransferase family 4 protein [Actinobacteria bacterium]|nr:glycosyltransferase family 4 protein [Actinomycetota bacterium]
MTRVVVDCHMVVDARPGDAGNGRYALNLTRALGATASTPDRVSAFVRDAAGAKLLPGVETLRVPTSDILRLGWAAPRALRGGAVGVFHYVIPAWASGPVVAVIHDVTFRTHPEWLDRRTRLLLNALVPRTIRRADHLVAVSETLRTDLVAAFGIPEERISVVLPSSEPECSPRPGAAARVAERHGLTNYCLAVADISPRKNLAALADAVRRVGGGLELAVAGAPGHRGREILASMGCRALGRVTSDDLADLYTAARVCCQPSLYEAFGLPVLEALACGAPLVVANRGAMPEIVGDAALVAEPTVDALAEAISAALEPATADRLRLAAPTRAATFSVSRTGKAAWAAVASASAQNDR